MVSVLHLFRFHWFSGVTKTDLIAGTLLWVQPVRQEGWILPLFFSLFFCLFGACHWLRLKRVSNSAWNLEWECIAAAFWKYKIHEYFFFPFSYLCLIEVEDTNLSWCWNWFFSPRAGIAHSSPPPHTQSGQCPWHWPLDPLPPPTLPKRAMGANAPDPSHWTPSFRVFSVFKRCALHYCTVGSSPKSHPSRTSPFSSHGHLGAEQPSRRRWPMPFSSMPSLQRIRCLRVQPFLLHNFLRS